MTLALKTTEFLKGHLCFLPFTFSLLTLYYLPLPIYFFLPYTTFNLLFLFTILVLLFTISNLLLFLPFTTFNLILHDIVPFTVFVLLFITSNLHVLLFLYFLYLFIYYRQFNFKLIIPSWFYYIPRPFYFFTVTSHFLQPKFYKLNYSKTNMKIINST